MTQKAICLDLPWPPSLNHIWRSKGRKWTGKGKPVYLSPEYAAWKEQALWIVKLGKHQPIKGRFSTMIILNPPDKRQMDIDNRVKVLLDLAEKSGLVENDRLCHHLTVSYGGDEFVHGVRLILAAMEG